ncbi:hypothetical protein VTH06DRAFT_3454 [Thermothelomyces fergusii]
MSWVLALFNFAALRRGGPCLITLLGLYLVLQNIDDPEPEGASSRQLEFFQEEIAMGQAADLEWTERETEIHARRQPTLSQKLQANDDKALGGWVGWMVFTRPQNREEARGKD